MRIKGIGAKASLSVKCLNADEIKQLTGSNIDPSVPTQSCYTVVFVSASSSSISKAITSYVNADSEFGAMVARSSTTAPVALSSGVVGDVVKSVVADAVNKPAEIVVVGAANAAASLDNVARDQVKHELSVVADKAKDEATKEKLHAASNAIQ